MKIIQVIDVGGGTRSQFFLSLEKKNTSSQTEGNGKQNIWLFISSFSVFYLFVSLQSNGGRGKVMAISTSCTIWKRIETHTHTSRLMFMLFDQKYENIWSFIAVHDVRCRHTTSPVNESILINAYEIHVEGTREPLKLFLEMRWSRASCTHHYAYAHKQTARNACT